MIDFQCQGCGSKLQIDDSQAGHKILCPQCQKIQDVPGVPAPHFGVICTTCGKEMDVDAHSLGKMARCPHCGGMTMVPGQSKDAEGCLGLVAVLLTILTTSLTGLAWLVLT
jgi:DNA-directed RNA polymerase subunit RPC12/RpoP